MDPGATWIARAVRAASRVLGEHEWGDALANELSYIDNPSDRSALALGGVLGLGRMAAGRRIACWMRESRTLGIFGAAGCIIGIFDLQSDSRTLLRLALLATCVIAGAVRPRMALALGTVIGFGLPLAVIAIGFGPYATDRGDVWFPVLPALMVTLLAARARLRLLPRA